MPLKPANPGPLQVREAVEQIAVCPHCGYEADRASHVDKEGGKSVPPAAGDLTVCINCAGWSFYSDDLSLRIPTVEEIASLDPGTRTVLNQLIRAATHLHENKHG